MSWYDDGEMYHVVWRLEEFVFESLLAILGFHVYFLCKKGYVYDVWMKFYIYLFIYLSFCVFLVYDTCVCIMNDIMMYELHDNEWINM